MLTSAAVWQTASARSTAAPRRAVAHVAVDGSTGQAGVPHAAQTRPAVSRAIERAHDRAAEIAGAACDEHVHSLIVLVMGARRSAFGARDSGLGTRGSDDPTPKPDPRVPAPARRPAPTAQRRCICFRVMFKRQTTGSVVCASCGSLVGVNDEQCYSCGRRNPGLWGFAPMLRRLGNDLGFVTLVVYGCSVLYVMTLLSPWCSAATSWVAACSGCLGRTTVSLLPSAPWRPAGIRLRDVVDHPQRRLAAWRRPAHPVQHDVGPAARPASPISTVPGGWSSSTPSPGSRGFS